jgi:hypothetical protein
MENKTTKNYFILLLIKWKYSNNDGAFGYLKNVNTNWFISLLNVGLLCLKYVTNE